MMQRDNMLKMLKMIVSELDTEIACDPRQAEALSKAIEHLHGAIREIFQAPSPLPLYRARMDVDAYARDAVDGALARVYAKRGTIVDVLSIDRDLDGALCIVSLNGLMLRVPMALLTKREEKDYETMLSERYPDITRWYREHPTAPSLAEVIRDTPCTEDAAARLYSAVLHWVTGDELQIATLGWVIAAMRAGWQEDGVMALLWAITQGYLWLIELRAKGR